MRRFIAFSEQIVRIFDTIKEIMNVKGETRVKILLLDGTVFKGKTTAVLQQVQKYLDEMDTDFEFELVSLGDAEHAIVDGRPFEEYPESMQEIVTKIQEADGYIIASPIFQGSIPGVLKNIFDMLHPKAMRYKPVSMIGNGGTYQHHLVVEGQLKPILDYFRCLVTPNYVYTHRDHFNENNEIIDEDVHDRLREMARVFVEYAKMSKVLQPSEPLDKQ